MITHIIWDYNGTVVDDVDASVAAVNDMLNKRNLPLTTKEQYIETVALPLDNYYKGLGISEEDMAAISTEFQTFCKNHSNLIHIFDDFFVVMQELKKFDIKNILMSSLYKDFLLEDMKKFNLSKYFDDVIGMNDKLVGSKLENAKNYIAKNHLKAENVLFIGDLVSDAKIAKTLNANCILIPNGHNSKTRCLSEEVTVFDDLKCIIGYLQKS